MGNIPNLYFVGTAKSGTTSLFEYLRQHPDIYTPLNEKGEFGKVSSKEPKFFSSKYHKYPHNGIGDIGAVDARTVKTMESYMSFYKNYGGQRMAVQLLL